MDFKAFIFVLVAVAALFAGILDYVDSSNPRILGNLGAGVSGFVDNPTGYVTGIYKEDTQKTVDFKANLTLAAPISLEFRQPVEVVRLNYLDLDNIFYINGISMNAAENTLFEARDFDGNMFIGNQFAINGKAKQLRVDKAFMTGDENRININAKNITYETVELISTPQFSLTIPGASGKIIIYNMGDTITYEISNKDIRFITFGGNMKFYGNQVELTGIGTIKTSTLTTITD